MLANILFFALTGLFLGSAALYLSYGSLSSGAWYWAYGAIQQGEAYYNLGGLVEFYRLLLLMVLFVITQISLFPDAARPYWEGRLRPLSFYQHFFKSGPRWLRFFAIALGVVTVVYSAVGGPSLLRGDFEGGFQRQPTAPRPVDRPIEQHRAQQGGQTDQPFDTLRDRGPIQRFPHSLPSRFSHRERTSIQLLVDQRKGSTLCLLPHPFSTR